MYIQGISIMDGGPCYRGGYAVIRQGIYKGKLVAVKMPRCNKEISDAYSVSPVFSTLDAVILFDDAADASGGPYMATA
jgi:hypothetical protein